MTCPGHLGHCCQAAAHSPLAAKKLQLWMYKTTQISALWETIQFSGSVGTTRLVAQHTAVSSSPGVLESGRADRGQGALSAADTGHAFLERHLFWELEEAVWVLGLPSQTARTWRLSSPLLAPPAHQSHLVASSSKD